MQRFVVIIVLLVSLGLLGKGALESWQPLPLPAPPASEDRDRRPAQAASEQQRPVAYYPQLPPLMPDLKEGYMFNAERHLGLESEAEEEKEEKVDPTVSEAPVDIEGLVYVGSIIIGKLRRGMVTYSLAQPTAPEDARKPGGRGAMVKPPGQPQQQPQQRARSTRQPAAAQQPPRKPSSGELKHGTADEGGKFFGFTVAKVMPDKIVFERNGQTIERLLYDPDKERKAAPPKAVAAAPAPAPGQPQPGQPQPGQPQPAVGGGPHFAPGMSGQPAPQPGQAVQPAQQAQQAVQSTPVAMPPRTPVVQPPPAQNQPRLVPPGQQPQLAPGAPQRPGATPPLQRRTIIPATPAPQSSVIQRPATQ